MPARVFLPLVFVVLCLGSGFTEASKQSSTADQKHTIRVGITLTMNRSNRQIIPTWERDQLVRELPDGSERAPILLGNAESNKTLAMNFTLVEVSTAQSVTEGTATASVEGNNDVRAADDTMRFVAHRVASELRGSAPLKLD